MDTVWFATGNNPNNYEFYMDAISYSWDPDYTEGDNRYEGLLLSYDSSVTLDWQGYSLDGKANRTIFGNSTFPIPNDGVHSIQIFGNDSMGINIKSELRYFSTTTAPYIIINSPLTDTLTGINSPSFDLTISGTDLANRWYSLDGGATNISFGGLTGTIDQTEWNKIGNGTVTITFYANDTLNNIGQAFVTILKDVLAPDITITDPVNTEVFEFAPIYDITIQEANLDEIWYTIDNGVHNYTITELSGTIDSNAWNSAPEGSITLRFYARDSMGNIGTNYVIVVKDIPEEPPTPPPEIPGYDFFVLIGVAASISWIYWKKRTKD
jgi:hypothetical protein